jgi:hypothetical protein
MAPRGGLAFGVALRLLRDVARVAHSCFAGRFRGALGVARARSATPKAGPRCAAKRDHQKTKKGTGRDV